MSAPPESLTPDELWVQITQAPRPFRVVDFPRNDTTTGKPVGQIAIWVLTQEEAMICQTAAERFVREMLKENVPKKEDAQEGYINLYRNAACLEVLWRACRRTKDMKYPAFPSPGEMRKHMTTFEIGILQDHYNRVQTELGPYVSDFSIDEIDAWISRLMEGGSRYFLDLLPSEGREALIERLVSLLRSSWTATTSPGEPPANGSDGSTPSVPAPERLPDQ